MGIGTLTIYKDDIKKYWPIYGNNVYLTNGQGCHTVWFPTVPVARKALKKDGIITGKDLADCSKCQCHYSYSDPIHDTLEPHICRQAKEDYAKDFE